MTRAEIEQHGLSMKLIGRVMPVTVAVFLTTVACRRIISGIFNHSPLPYFDMYPYNLGRLMPSYFDSGFIRRELSGGST